MKNFNELHIGLIFLVVLTLVLPKEGFGQGSSDARKHRQTKKSSRRKTDLTPDSLSPKNLPNSAPQTAIDPNVPITIQGVILDKATNEPLIGASITITDQNSGVLITGGNTGDDGSYNLTFQPDRPLRLKVQYLGMKPIVQDLDFSKKNYDFSLEEEYIALKEVVITALNRIERKGELGYSVQEIKSAEIERSGEYNVVQALSAKIAGVQVIQSSGMPGASSTILIRGGASITGNNQPIFVVDGVPVDNSTFTATTINEGVQGSNRAVDINPDDIASITVLKGPAAAALYGTRAGSGAVIITTNKGNKGTPGLSLNYKTSVEFSQVNRLPELQSKYSQGTGGQYDPTLETSWGSVVNNTPGLSTYDPLTIFRTGISTSNSIAITQNTDIGAFRLSIGRQAQNGVLQNANFIRNSFRFSYDSRINEQLTITLTANYINTNSKRLQQGSNTSGLMLGLLRTPANFDNAAGFENIDGTQRSFSPYFDNPNWTLEKNLNDERVNRLFGNATLVYEPFKNLSDNYKFLKDFDITNRTGTDIYSLQENGKIAVYSTSNPLGFVFQRNIVFREFYNDLMLNYRQNLTRNWSLGLTLGNNLNERKTDDLYVQGGRLSLPNFYNLSNAADISGVQSSINIRIISFFSILKLKYKEVFTINVTGRQETSSTFGQNNPSNFYPSINTSFNLSELPDYKALGINRVANALRIKAAFSVVGIEPPPYSTQTYYQSLAVLDRFGIGFRFPFLGQNGYSLGDNIGNANLRPEGVRGYEGGFDAQFFGNRLGVDFTYYYQLTTNAIFSIPVASTSGFMGIIGNAGRMTNQGIELSVVGTPLSNKGVRSKLNWEVEINFARNRNMVEALAPGMNTVILGGFPGADIRAVVGKPYGQLYGPRFARTADGKLIIGQDGFPIIDPVEQPLGNIQPDYLIGFRNAFTYKGLTFAFLWDIRLGGQLWNGTRGTLVHYGTAKETENRGQTYVFDGVTETGEKNTKVVVLDEKWYTDVGGGFSGPTDQFTEDASWVRLRDASLTYRLRLKVRHVQSVDASLTARNALLFTKYKGIDPETNLSGAGSNARGLDYFNMPNTRSLIVGLNFLFD